MRAEGIQGLDFTRVISIANTVHLLRERKAVVQGLGYGSWYSDAYLPFPVAGDLASGFETESIEQRRFYRVHDFVFHMLLKVGLAGLVLYLAAFWRPLRTAWIKRRALRHDWRWTVSMVSWSAAPVIITSMYWSGKGLLLCALFAATADAIARTLEGSRERESLT